MASRLRVGAVRYLNARPLIHDLERGPAGARIDLVHDVPSAIAEGMRAGRIDLGLLPVIELARIPDLEIVPGLGIVTRGPARSVLLLARTPPGEVRTLAPDPDSRTSNGLARVLLARVWNARPTIVPGEPEAADAVVRIGDRALYEPVPEGFTAHDLGRVWTDATGLPFVFAVWAARPGVVDRELYQALHEARRAGTRALDAIAGAWTWNGCPQPERSRAYLRENIVYRLGTPELRGLETFLEAAREIGVIDRVPELRLALRRHTECDEVAAQWRGL